MHIAMETVDIQNIFISINRGYPIIYILIYINIYILFPSSPGVFTSLFQEHRSWCTGLSAPGQPCGVRRPLAVAQKSRGLSNLPRAATAVNGRRVSRQGKTVLNGMLPWKMGALIYIYVYIYAYTYTYTHTHTHTHTHTYTYTYTYTYIHTFKGCRPCRRPRKKWQRIKPNGHKYSSVLRTFRSSQRSKPQKASAI